MLLETNAQIKYILIYNVLRFVFANIFNVFNVFNPKDSVRRVLCPRVHFKMFVFDCKEVYIGSANLTGAGIGMKAEGTRNFEAGILTDDLDIVE